MNTIISKAISGQLDTEEDSIHELMHDMLSAIRKHLHMEFAFISEFEGGRRFFRYINSDHPDPIIKINDSDPLEDSYCQRVVDGRLPEIIHDATKNPVAKKLPVTDALPVGAHLSVPIELSNGDIFGTFCAFSREADLTLQDRDLELMRTFSEIASKRIEKELESKKSRKIIESRINALLEGDSLSMVYQPIFRLDDNQIMGFESLARFNIEPRRGPDVWFDEAASVDLNIPLELKAIEIALQGLEHLPSHVYIAVNISPETVIHGALENTFEGFPVERIMLEITEHRLIQDYAEINDSLRALRKQGLQVAVDDAGAGYSSFRHILNLGPDLIKIDMSLTRNIDKDPARRSMAAAFVRFAKETGAKLVAEGVETEAERETLLKLGVTKAQGYLLGKPAGMKEARQFFNH